MRRLIAGLAIAAAVLFVVFTLTTLSSSAQPLDRAASDLAPTADCLQQVGDPYENGDQVCIKVKNVCTGTVAVKSTITTHNFGLHAEAVATDTHTVTIEPGQTAEICSPKPGASGHYCFNFNVGNLDQQLPLDRVTAWLNNVKIATTAGAIEQGSFHVGGSGEITTPVLLTAVMSQLDWQIQLSQNTVAPENMPATVTYTVQVPFTAPPGETVTATILGFDQVHSGSIAGANVIFTIDPSMTFLPVVARNYSPMPGSQPPAPVLFYPDQASGTIAGTSFLLAWDAHDEYDIQAARFEYFDGISWTPIGPSAEEHLDIVSDAWQATWATNPLPAGNYPVRVTLIDANGQSGTVTTTVRIAKLPIATATASFASNVLTLDGSASHDPDGAIEQWLWNFGDGASGVGFTTTHTYTDPLGTYFPALTVVDNEGYSTTAYYETVPISVPLAARKDCGCKSMDVKTSGSSAMAMYWMTDTVSHTLGAVNTIPNPLPAPPPAGPFYLFYNFEVEAQLKDGSDPALCVEGQWAKGTTHIDNHTGHKTDNGHEYPYAGGTLGPDGSDQVSSIKEHAGLAVNWVDAPGWGDPKAGHGVSGNTIATSGAQGVTWQSKFYGLVSGPSGTCECTWEVEWTIQSNGAVTEAPMVKNKVCTVR